MRRIVTPSIAVTLAVLLASCGQRNAPGADTTAASTTAAAATPATAASTSALDAGPRASDTSADHELAEEGGELFQTKGCTACHGWGQRMSGPDLKGVSQRRTAAWIEAQILDPEKMTKADPIAKKLYGEFMLQMPNQGLTPPEAKAVVEYFKSRDAAAASH